MFPDKKAKGGDKPQQKPAQGRQQDLHNPAQPVPQYGQKPGRGMDAMEAMMAGMGDLSQFAPPPPPPGAPLGPGGLPIGGGLPSGDPGMDPQMGGSSLFQALNMGLDPFASPPEGHGELDPPPDLDTLLALLAMQNAGMGGQGQSGVMPDPTRPGEAQGLQQFNVMQ